MIDPTETEETMPNELQPEDKQTFQLAGPSRLTDWKKEPELMALKADLDAAKPAHDTMVANVKRWNDLLEVTGDAKPPKVKGRSSVQPKLIKRQAGWRYSALSEPFLNSDKIFKVSPVTFEDVEAAKQNEALLNYQFRTKIDRVAFIDNLVRSLVDDGTAIVRLGWLQTTKTVQKVVPTYAHYPVQSQQEADMLQRALEMKQTDFRTYSEKLPPELQAAVDFFEENGQATVAVQQGEQTVEEEVIDQNKPTVELVNPANVYIDPSCEGQIDKALFAIVSFETNKAELLQEPDRYKNLDKVNWEGNTTITDGNHEAATVDTTFQFRDSARKKVVAYEYWGYYDIEGNGVLQPIVATWIGDTLVRMERNPFPDRKLPFVVIPYTPLKRALFGEPDAELLEDNQKILGAVTRGMVDLLGQSANGQKGFAKGMLDPLNRRKYENGQDYEFNPAMPTTQGIIEHKFPELPQSALIMLNLQNQEAESLTGVKAFSGGLSGDAYGTVATGIKGLLDAAAKREMSILRRLAKGVAEIGRKIMGMNSEFLTETEVIRVTNEQFVTIKREDLPGEFDTVVDISTAEVDNAKAQDLGFMLQTLGPNMDPRISMMILAEIAELKRMPRLAHTLRNWQPQPDPMQQQIQQLEIQKLQMEVAKLQSEVVLNQANAQQAMATAGLKALEKVEQETGVKHARNIIETQAQGRANQHLEVTKALLKSKKPEEKDPDVNAAIGYNTLSGALEEENLLGPNRR